MHSHETERHVAILTGGADQPYAYGLSTALMAAGIRLDLIAGDELDAPCFHGDPVVRFLNLRGDTRPNVGATAKVVRILRYYVRLIRYALTAQPRVFHVLWNNKFETFDRTVLMLYYRLLGKRIVLTVHNVNAGVRDQTDSRMNRFTLRFQYRMADRIFVHTEKMKAELSREFEVRDEKIVVIPFGINNAAPKTTLTSQEARARLAIGPDDKTILFFGNILPYKGLEYLLAAFKQLPADGHYRLVVAGRPRGSEAYWNAIRAELDRLDRRRLVERIEFVPDAETEIYFKAADVLVLPYTEIFQSGVLFLGYSFGLPVIATDVGSLREEIVTGQTGFVCAKESPSDLAAAIETYFASDLYRTLDDRRRDIAAYANDRYSWTKVSRITTEVYADLVGGGGAWSERRVNGDASLEGQR